MRKECGQYARFEVTKIEGRGLAKKKVTDESATKTATQKLNESRIERESAI